MADYRLKIKIGEHEFEAEGPTEVVQSQFEIFKELVARAPVAPEKLERNDPAPSDEPMNGSAAARTTSQLDLEKIMRADGRTISLTVVAQSATEAVLLLMLGQRQFRSNDSVTGGELAQGLRESGYPNVRSDYITDRLAREGAVITIGERRSRRYRMTNLGVTRAQDIARNLIALVP